MSQRGDIDPQLLGDLEYRLVESKFPRMTAIIIRHRVWGLFLHSWMFLDFLTHVILPGGFGLYHFFLIGGLLLNPIQNNR